jgi:diadenylate cyclase
MSLEQLQFLVPGLYDVLEILIVAYVIYRLLLFLAGTRALQILIGITALFVVYFVALVLKLNMISSLLGVVFTYGAFAAIVVFQPELRNALARLGRSRLVGFLASSSKRVVADEIAEATGRLARNGTGAIIAVERDVSLDEFVESGTPMRATVSADLLATIFTPYSPLHDGAVLVRGDQIIGAGAVLPLTQFPVSDKSLGTRHRAALGLSEESDAVVVVVSEETSKISMAMRGMLRRGITPDQVRTALAGPEEASLALTSARGDASPA